MAQTASGSVLYTTVKNTSGAERVFSFLGDHGKKLAANETFTQRGNLVDKLGSKRSRRDFDALERALKAQDLALVSTPGVHLYDSALDLTRVLALNNDSLGIVDPSWEEAGSSTFRDDQ